MITISETALHLPAAPEASAARSVRTADVDDQAHSLLGWEQCYRQLSRGAFQGELDYFSLPDVELMFEGSNQTIHQLGHAPQGKVVLGLPLKAEGDGWLGGRPFHQDCVIAVGTSSQFSFRTPLLLTVGAIILDASLLMEAASSFHMEALVGAVLNTGRACLSPATAGPLRTCMAALRDTFRSVPAWLPHGSAQRASASSVICQWLHALDGTDRMELSLPRRRQQRERIVLSAQAYVREHLADIPTSLDICRSIHVHERVLQYCFLEALAISPTAYVRHLRLHEVRKELRANAADTVGDIAARWGFWHPSRLSADYKQLFGELPSETRSPRRPCPSLAAVM